LYLVSASIAIALRCVRREKPSVAQALKRRSASIFFGNSTGFTAVYSYMSDLCWTVTAGMLPLMETLDARG
jgi:hypothetical protein